MDCAVLDFDDRLLVAKTDPITFATEEIGWYAVHVNANDIATSGAQPRWFLASLLLPERTSDAELAKTIFGQIQAACDEVGAQLVGGHTEITAGLDRPIIVGTMLGEVARHELVTPKGAAPGNKVILTKGVPIEAASILAREFGERLTGIPPELTERAKEFLRKPGISVVPEALTAARVGGVSAMHDPTEGGIACGLWEVTQAAGVRLRIDPAAIHVLPEALMICQALGVDPLAAIASGALLICVEEEASEPVCEAIRGLGIAANVIGEVEEGKGVVLGTGEAMMERPERDAIAQLFEGT